MLPPKTLKNIIFINKVGWLLGAVPHRFQLCPETKKMVVAASFTVWRTAYVHGTFCILMGYILFLVMRLFHKILFTEDYTVKFVVQMTYQIFGYTQIAVIHFNSLYMFREVPHFFACYQRYFNLLKDRYISPGTWGPKCLKFFYAWYFVGFVVNSQNCILIIKKPHRHHYLTSLFEDPKRTPILYRLPLMLIHLIVWFSGWSQVLCLVFHLYSYMSCLVWAIRELDIKLKSKKTSDDLREPRTFMKVARDLHVLHRLWQNAHETFFCPAHKFVAISVSTLGTYGVIKLHGPVAILMGCMAAISTLYLWTLFSKFGQLYVLSQEVLENWMHSSASSKRMRKFVKSIPIFRVNIGSFYKVERLTVFTALDTILNNTITLLFL